MRLRAAMRWSAYIIGFLFSGLLLLFSMDAIPREMSVPDITGFAIHTLPGLLSLTAMIIGIRKPRIGGGLFFVLHASFILLLGLRDNMVPMLIFSAVALWVGGNLVFNTPGRARYRAATHPGKRH